MAKKRYYLVTGLESSTTKIFAINLAKTLIGSAANDYDGHGSCIGHHDVIQHLSMPHGARKKQGVIDLDLFRDIDTAEYEKIIICTRDYNCSLRSKINTHQPNVHCAIAEHRIGMLMLRKLVKADNAHVFSYESWYLLGNDYVEEFYKRNLGISYTYKGMIEPLEINNKHLIKL